MLLGMTLASCSDNDTGEITPIKIEYERVTQTDFAAQSNEFGQQSAGYIGC